MFWCMYCLIGYCNAYVFILFGMLCSFMWSQRQSFSGLTSVSLRSLWNLVSVVVFFKYAFILASVERAVFNGPHVRSTGPAFFDTAMENNCKVGSQFALEFAVSGWAGSVYRVRTLGQLDQRFWYRKGGKWFHTQVVVLWFHLTKTRSAICKARALTLCNVTQMVPTSLQGRIAVGGWAGCLYRPARSVYWPRVFDTVRRLNDSVQK